MPLPARTRLGPYEILTPLGAGGMGEVYRARDTRLNRIVAIKVLPGRLTHDPQLRERFEREACAVSSLNHPNICVLHDIGDEAGVGFLVMEYLEGETLAVRIGRGPLPASEALRFAIVGVNDINPTSAAAPFGGMKESGLGREGGQEGIVEYLETKLVGISVS